MVSANEVQQAFVGLSSDLFQQQLHRECFFDSHLMNCLSERFGLERAVVVVYDQDCNFLSTIDRHGDHPNTRDHIFHDYSRIDPCCHHIHRVCTDTEPTVHRPMLFQASEMVRQYDRGDYFDFLETFGFRYSISLPFGPQGRFHLAIYKRAEQGDYSDRERDVFSGIYTMLHGAYGAFEQLRLRETVQTLRGGSTPAPDGCELILDEGFGVLSCTDNASEYLSALYTAPRDSVVGTHLLFLELLFDEPQALECPRRAVFKNLHFCITPFTRTDQLAFTRRYYRLTISHTPPIRLPDELVREALGRLTPKEKEIAREMAGGLTYREVAERLHISTYTVRNHMSHIYRKLEIKNQRQLVNLYRSYEQVHLLQ